MESKELLKVVLLASVMAQVKERELKLTAEGCKSCALKELAWLPKSM
jgi:hypothetical protein